MMEAQNIEHVCMSFEGHRPEEDMDFESGTNRQSFQLFGHFRCSFAGGAEVVGPLELLQIHQITLIQSRVQI